LFYGDNAEQERSQLVFIAVKMPLGCGTWSEDEIPEPSLTDIFFQELGAGLRDVGSGIAEPFLVIGDSVRITCHWLGGGTREEFEPWSGYGEYCMQELQRGSSAGEILADAAYRETGDPEAWRKASGGQFLIAVALRSGTAKNGAAGRAAGASELAGLESQSIVVGLEQARASRSYRPA